VTDTQTHSLTHSLLRLTSEGRRVVATSTTSALILYSRRRFINHLLTYLLTSDPALMTTASRLCTRDLLPPVVSKQTHTGKFIIILTTHSIGQTNKGLNVMGLRG